MLCFLRGKVFLPVRFYRSRRARWIKLQEEKARARGAEAAAARAPGDGQVTPVPSAAS